MKTFKAAERLDDDDETSDFTYLVYVYSVCLCVCERVARTSDRIVDNSGVGESAGERRDAMQASR